MDGMRTTRFTLFGIALLLVAVSVLLTVYAGINPIIAVIWNVLSALSINYEMLPQNATATPLILTATAIDAFVFALFAVVLATMFLDFIRSFDFKRRLVAKKIRKLKNHVILAPDNPFARALAKELDISGIPHVTISEKEEEAHRLYRINELALVGDPKDVEAYLNANVAQAMAVVACGEDDTVNALISITAKDVSPGIKIIARTSSVDDLPRLGKAGCSRMIMPEVSAGEELGKEIARHVIAS
jgi:voltage-gated potassium channel